MPDNGVDVIAVAQAFHWFDSEKCIKEFHRITKEKEYSLLICNLIKENEFNKDYTGLYKKYSKEYSSISHEIDEEKIKESFKSSKIM